MMWNISYKWVELSTDGNVPCPRSSHDLSIVGGKLYVFGGEGLARTPIDSSIYSLDLSTNHWTKEICNGEPPSMRIAHSQCVIGDKIYVFGGRSGVEMSESPLNDLFSYDTRDCTWAGPIVPVAGSVPSERSFHKVIAIEPYIYVFGGCSSTDRCSDLYQYDTLGSSWEALPVSEAIAGRGGPCLLPVINSSAILVSAGYSGQENNDIHLYDIRSKRWQQIEALHSEEFRARSVCPCFASSTGDFAFLFGGEISTSERGHEGAGDFASDVVCIETSTGRILSARPIGTQPCPRGWTSMALLSDTGTTDSTRCVSAVLFGGLTGSDEEPKRLNDVWRLDVRISSAD